MRLFMTPQIVSMVYDGSFDLEGANLHRYACTWMCVGFDRNLLGYFQINEKHLMFILLFYWFNHVFPQPESSIRYYRRLIQMGVSNSELWNNIGLCCFYAAQYDMSLGCFERALGMANDDVMADIWWVLFICDKFDKATVIWPVGI